MTCVTDSVESDLGYSDGVYPKQQCVFIVTAQELDVGRVFLDAGMLGQAERTERLKGHSLDLVLHFHLVRANREQLIYLYI